MAIDTAVDRHAGSLDEVTTPMGTSYMQTGKDLSNVSQIVVTGGSLIHTKKTDKIAAHALYSAQNPYSLRPTSSNVLVDRKYILASMGLLGEHYPDVAVRIMKNNLQDMGKISTGDNLDNQIDDAEELSQPGCPVF